MSSLRNHNVWVVLAVIYAGVFSTLIIFQVLHLRNVELLSENNWLENIQAGLYSFSAVTLLIRGFTLRGLARWLFLFFGMTCLSFSLRELDVEDLDVAEIFILLGSGKGRNWLFIIAFTLLTHLFIRRYMSTLRSFKQWRKSIVVQLCLLGCLVLIVGAVGDELDMLLLEELSEFNGAFLISLSAILFTCKPKLLTDYIREMDSL